MASTDISRVTGSVWHAAAAVVSVDDVDDVDDVICIESISTPPPGTRYPPRNSMPVPANNIEYTVFHVTTPPPPLNRTWGYPAPTSVLEFLPPLSLSDA